ncbi:NUDIX hydrolase [Patescibacteria group bacterium]|nr:NUDIX hydrolase [Patescibacteria group bacterium]MBU1921823.1 NUDIX hydrolase [Patescibacteria group bacterium]
MKVIPFSEVPGKEPGWKRGEGDVVLYHPTYGEIRHVWVCDKEGKPHHDQFLHNEPIGAVTMPMRKDGKVGFITADRPCFPPGKEHFPLKDFEVLGCESLELPRGFPKKGERSEQTAKREGAEEIGSPILEVSEIGQITPNTTFNPHRIPVYLAKIDEDFVGEVPPDVNEKILGKVFLSKDEIMEKLKNQEIFCGFTLAALSLWAVNK